MNIVMSDGKPHESIALYFYPEENMVYDEDSNPILNLYYYVPPRIWQVFKYNQSYMCFHHKDGFFVELFYPEPDEE